MIDAIVGAVIMVMATSSLLMALEVAQKAFDDAGQYPLTPQETDILNGVGIGSKDWNQFWLTNIKELPRDVQ